MDLAILYNKLEEHRAESVDPDEVARYEPSHLDLHGLQIFVLIFGAVSVVRFSKFFYQV